MSNYEIALLGELSSPVLLIAVVVAAAVGGYVLGLRARRRTDRMVDFQSFMQERQTARHVQHLRHVATLAEAQEAIAKAQQVLDDEEPARSFTTGRAPVLAGSDLPPRDAGIPAHVDAALILQRTLVDPGEMLVAVAAEAPTERVEQVEQVEQIEQATATSDDTDPPSPPSGLTYRYTWPDWQQQAGTPQVRGVMPREWLGTLRQLMVASLTALAAAVSRLGHVAVAAARRIVHAAHQVAVRATARRIPHHRRSARQVVAERRERVMREWYAELRAAVFGQPLQRQPGQHRSDAVRRRLAPDWQERQREIADRLFAPMGGRL